MALVLTDSKNYTDIANAIREKIGSADTFLPSEMADAILEISGGGGGASIPAPFTKFAAGTFSIADSEAKKEITDLFTVNHGLGTEPALFAIFRKKATKNSISVAMGGVFNKLVTGSNISNGSIVAYNTSSIASLTYGFVPRTSGAIHALDENIAQITGYSTAGVWLIGEYVWIALAM